MELIPFLRQHVQISSEQEIELDRAFKMEILPKGHKLLLPGNHSNKVFFFEHGLARSFYIKHDKDITHYFYLENTFNMPIESIFYNNASPYGLELLEKTVVRTITYPEAEKYFDQSIGLQKVARLLLIDVLSSFSKRLYSLQFQSAQERYQTLIAYYPDILLRAPLGHIASYLGITQQTLSVIRAQKYPGTGC